ncbi:hypothetical protein [Paenibacillus kobensis]|uniref:hypothetical protein n=1 Tax=Paenibacillus kobensis TaxID=59841 RepID=UPI000FD8F40B|nr:hypothetical protein [Paenibacillus kobensis]
MKKKVWIIGTGLVVGSALMVSSAFANMGDARGYEAYKTALKTTAAVDNATQHIVLSVRDNGSELLNVDATVKESQSGSAVSSKTSIRTGAETAAIDFYKQQEGMIIKNSRSDIYNVVKGENEQDDQEREWNGDPAFDQSVEKIIDALVGNVKNNFTLSEASGGRTTVEMKLAGSQIPTAANVIGSIIVKEALSGKHSQAEHGSKQPEAAELLGLDLKQLDPHLPQLSDQVNIDQITLHANIDEHHYVTDQTLELTVSGKDASGHAHKLVVSADIGISGIDTTVPDKVDLAGKKVKVIEEADLKE